jgi:predicted secreted hydrolase
VRRRRALLCLLLPAAAAAGTSVQRGRVLQFPRDHGAHIAARTEWWYTTGWLGTFESPLAGFQVTFFRSRTGLAQGNSSRFAARQLLFAHAAVTDLRAARHRHADRIVRWSEAPGAAPGAAALDDTDVHIGGWRLHHDGQAYLADVDADGIALALRLQSTQPLLLQGEAGFSRKGPDEAQASHYVSEPQLAASGSWQAGGASATGSAWLDHEWSDEILHPQAVGWDWMGINLQDGSALTCFRLRRADGTALWAGGSWRRPGTATIAFGPQEVTWQPGRTWTSPSSGGRYPVQWTVSTPAGRFGLRALMDTQELDGRASAGSVYWEGLSELLDGAGRRVGLGYLEMTGYVGKLRL